MAWGVVLHQEPSGGAILVVHRKKAGEAEELVVWSLQLVEQPRDHRGEALEAGAAWPRWATSIPHLLPLSSHPASGEEAADVGLL